MADLRFWPNLDGSVDRSGEFGPPHIARGETRVTRVSEVTFA
jgi:hypothetical protein